MCWHAYEHNFSILVGNKGNQQLISSVCDFKIFFRHKAFGKSWLNIWIPEVCLTLILRLQLFCNEIGKYPLGFVAKTGNTWINAGLLPFVAKHLQDITFINVLTFCWWLRYTSSLSSPVFDILYKLLDELNHMLANYVPAIVHMLMRCNKIKSTMLKSHCCLQDEVFLMHSPRAYTPLQNGKGK